MADEYDRFWEDGGWKPSPSSGVGFTPTQHSKVTAFTDPTTAQLPYPFVVLVTGAGKGIGKEIAFSYAKAHASGIVLCARTEADLAAAKAHIATLSSSTICLTAACDISSDDSVRALFALVKDTFGRLDVLVNNAGTIGAASNKIAAHSPKDFQLVTDINVVGTFTVSHYFLPLLLSSEGGAKTLVNITSISALMSRGACAYSMSKVAVNKFTEFLAGQYGKEGLLAYALHPGGVLTETGSDKSVPKQLLAFLNDDADLCGGFCVWLTKERRDWLNGRYLSAQWDVGELEAKKDDIVERDLLKMEMRI
ncbi:hypothetical protein MMC34_002576 [Xylographa carneopallida]|nr:hypothetical protein [Xylographa carneopallida]